MNSKDGKIFLDAWVTKVKGYSIPVVSYDDAVHSVELAEEEIKKKAIEAFKKNCPCWSRFQQDRKCDECAYLKDFCNQLD